jgi:hypothetical protein
MSIIVSNNSTYAARLKVEGKSDGFVLTPGGKRDISHMVDDLNSEVSEGFFELVDAEFDNTEVDITLINTELGPAERELFSGTISK